MRRARRSGFTLIELLIVLAIIAILIGLLLPAVQKVREAAARTACSNNLKQLALANMSYEHAYGTYLPGVGKNGCCWGTWMIPVLPYVEQDQLYKRYTNFGGLDTSGPRYNGGPNGAVAGTRLKTFTCPSDEPQATSGGTRHNYVLNAGNTTFYQVPLPLGCAPGTPGCIPFGAAPFGWYANSDLSHDSTYPFSGPGAPDPPLGQMGRPVKSAKITDGTSNTLLASETIQGRGGDHRGFTWWGGAAGFTAYMAPNSSEPDVITGGHCVALASPKMPCTATSTPSRPRLMGARSLHLGGVNVALCDGSVRFVSDAISMAVWQALSTARGGEVLPDTDF